MDNIFADRYLNNLGGTRYSILAHLASKFWIFCLDWGIRVQAEYLPGLHNTEVDWYSRNLLDLSDWQHDPDMFH